MIDYIQLLDHLSIGIVVLDREMVVLYWNRWMEEHSHLGKEEVENRPIYQIFPALVHREFVKKAHDVLQRGYPAFITSKGSQQIFPFYTSRSYVGSEFLQGMRQTVIISPLLDAESLPDQLLVSIFDITDWMTYQEQLLASKKELEKLSQLDELTKVPNRRSLVEKLRAELCIHARKKRPLSVAMIDIDHFKKVNDTYGHGCGDQVLCAVVQTLGEALRGYDTLGRYGGEEFVLILPETPASEGEHICERLRQRVEEKVFMCDEARMMVTISIGLAVRQAKSELAAGDVETLLNGADKALYEAKDRGRNRVVLLS